MASSLDELLAAALGQLGLPAPTNVIQTVLLKDRFFVGWKFRYDGGHAVLSPDGNGLRVYDDRGELLTEVTGEAAA